MTGKRPLLIGIGIGLIISSMLLAVISISGAFTPAVAQRTQQTERDTDKPETELKENNNSETELKEKNNPVNVNEVNEINSMNTVTVTIPSGSTAQVIAEIMFNQDLISDENAFLEKVKEREVAGKFKAGEFELEKEQDIDKLIDRLLELP